ncbi:hypothetical protein PUS82_14985 [Cytobacillus firmus]|uniref:hypothetical protein n=1 Tax=Cytobacillus firmus TaxID=1399 RepID=UPI00237AE5E5|nr:hypothetical protein [Cytobacillus firmus]MDD9312579.1 hypothetical protein [Cytobacillus firmus]
MSAIQKELKDWIANLSGNDKECEQKIRTLLNQDKYLVYEIKFAYEDNNTPRIKKLIKDYLSRKKIIVRTCKECSKKNLIYSDKLEVLKCEHCQQPLLKPKAKELVQHGDIKNKEQRRKCIYCGNEVSPLSNAVTCYSCRNVSFSLY